MLIYSNYDNLTQGTLSLLESSSVGEIYSINAVRTNAGIRVFDLYVQAGFDPTTPKRLVVSIPGQTGTCRGGVKDFAQFTLKNNNLEDFVIIGIYGKPLTKYRFLEDIQGDMISVTSGSYDDYTSIEELDISFGGFAIDLPSVDEFPYCDDEDFIRTVVGYVSTFLSVKEVIIESSSNGACLAQNMYSRRRDRVSKIITSSGLPTTSRTFGHSDIINTLNLHGDSDAIVPYLGGAGSGAAAGYTFIGGMDNLEDYVTNSGNAASLTTNTYGFSPTNLLPETIYDDGVSKINKMLLVVGGGHGVSELDDIDVAFNPDNAREMTGDYFYDFIQKYIPTKW